MTFVEELSEMGIINLFDVEPIIALTVKISRNKALLYVVNTSDKDFNFSPN